MRCASDHGTANQAIEWVLHVLRSNDLCDSMEFLKAWQQGDAMREWPDYYRWLDTQPTEQRP